MVKNLNVNNSSKTKIDKFLIHKIIHKLKEEFDLTIELLIINFVSAEEIKNINSEYLKHFHTTDIITFNYSGNKNIIDAELFISPFDANANAKKFKVSFNEEILRLVIHGILHLLGFDDKAQSEKKNMKKLENKLLNNYKFLLLSSRNK